MPEIKIKLPDDVHKKLKASAKDDMRSLTNYITMTLIKIANGDYNYIDTSGLPEGTTIRTKTTRPKTKEEIEEENIASFQKLAKQILGHEIPISDVSLDPNNLYFEYAVSHEDEGRYLRWAYEMPHNKQEEYLKEWKLYEDNE